MHLSTPLILTLLSVTSATQFHSHSILRRSEDDGLIALPFSSSSSESSNKIKRQEASVGGAGVGLSGVNAGIGNITLTVGNINISTGKVLLENIHIGDITVLISAGIGSPNKRALPTQSAFSVPLLSLLPIGANSTSPTHIIDGGIQLEIDEEALLKIYRAEAAATPTLSLPGPTPFSGPSLSADSITLRPTPTADFNLRKRQVGIGGVSASVGPVGASVGNVNVSVGDVLVSLGDITVKNVTIGNIFVSVAINAQGLLNTLVGAVESALPVVTSIVGGVTSIVGGLTSEVGGVIATTTAPPVHAITKLAAVKEREDGFVRRRAGLGN